MLTVLLRLTSDALRDDLISNWMWGESQICLACLARVAWRVTVPSRIKLGKWLLMTFIRYQIGLFPTGSQCCGENYQITVNDFDKTKIRDVGTKSIIYVCGYSYFEYF